MLFKHFFFIFGPTHRLYEQCMANSSLSPVFIMRHPVVTKGGDCSTFDITTVAEYLSEQLLVITPFRDNGDMKTGITAAVG